MVSQPVHGAAESAQVKLVEPIAPNQEQVDAVQISGEATGGGEHPPNEPEVFEQRDNEAMDLRDVGQAKFPLNVRILKPIFELQKINSMTESTL